MAVAILAIGLLLGMSLMLWVLPWGQRYLERQGPETTLRVVQVAIAVVFLGLIPFSAYFYWYGRRAVRSRRMPPPGTRVYPRHEGSRGRCGRDARPAGDGAGRHSFCHSASSAVSISRIVSASSSRSVSRCPIRECRRRTPASRPRRKNSRDKQTWTFGYSRFLAADFSGSRGSEASPQLTQVLMAPMFPALIGLGACLQRVTGDAARADAATGTGYWSDNAKIPQITIDFSGGKCYL